MNGFVFSSDSRYLVSKGCDDNKTACLQKVTQVWDADTGKEVIHKTYDGNVNIAIDQNGKYVASWSEDKTVHLWEAVTGNEIVSMIHNDPVNAVVFSPDGKYIIGVGCNNLCNQTSYIVWDPESGKELASFTHTGSIHPTTPYPSRLVYIGSISSTTFSSDSKYVTSQKCQRFAADGSCTKSSLQVWNTATGKTVADVIFNTHFNYFGNWVFSPDNKNIAIGSAGTVSVQEIATGRELIHITDGGVINSVAFSADGKYIVSSSTDKTARVWDVTTGTEVARMERGDGVSFAVFDLTGRYIISADSKEVKMWKWQAEDLIANACQHMPRNFTHAEWKQYIGDVLPYPTKQKDATCPNLPLESEITSTLTPINKTKTSDF